jgi:hypothetical protein
MPEIVGSKTRHSNAAQAGAQETGGMSMNGTFSETFRKYGGPILVGFGVIPVVVTLGVAFWLLMKLVPKDGSGSLALLAIGGVVVLILLLTAVAMIFQVLGLANGNQAMGLPEGSIRAVIALSLIVLFAILSVFLYQGVSTSGPLNTIANLSDTERAEFIRSHPTARDIQSVLVKEPPLKNADGTPKYFYDVSYRSTNATSDDFAKQLLVLLGTLMTAVTSFYLGAGTATSAAKAGETAKTAESPTVSSIDPASYSVANGPLIHLRIMGANLNNITHVKIARAGAQPVIGTNVHSSPTSVTCDIPVSTATTPPGLPWDVVVDDGGSKSFTTQGALTITA